jgi:hypothetical protein
MSEDVQSTATAEAPLRDQLARGDAAIAGARPVLRHLLLNRDRAMFSDEVLARVSGMLYHVARQLLAAGAGDNGGSGPGANSELSMAVDAQARALANVLAEDPALLAHAHGQALEARLVESLRHRTGFDGVVSPLVQELAASSDPAQAGLAMRVLAAQARFLQQQRRMELPLGELPPALLEKAWILVRSDTKEGEREEVLPKGLVQQESRLGLMDRLVRSMGQDGMKALATEYSGPALFLTALALGTGIDRTLAIYSCGEDQAVRLAISLRAAGLDLQQIRGQFLYLHPEVEVPEGLESTSPARAISILADPAAELVG